MYRARESDHQCWIIQREYPCTNGLSAWFEVARCWPPDQSELMYTDGAIESAEECAIRITNALNRPRRNET